MIRPVAEAVRLGLFVPMLIVATYGAFAWWPEPKPISASQGTTLALTGDFKLLDWHVEPKSANWSAKVVGEIRNTGDRPMSPVLQLVFRDQAGRVVDTEDFWPASNANVGPGETFAFSHFIRDHPAATVDLRIIGGAATSR